MGFTKGEPPQRMERGGRQALIIDDIRHGLTIGQIAEKQNIFPGHIRLKCQQLEKAGKLRLDERTGEYIVNVSAAKAKLPARRTDVHVELRKMKMRRDILVLLDEADEIRVSDVTKVLGTNPHTLPSVFKALEEQGEILREEQDGIVKYRRVKGKASNETPEAGHVSAAKASD